MPDYKPIRLSRAHRDTLLDYMRSRLVMPALDAAEERARVALCTALQDAVLNFTDPGDIAVLQKYGHTCKVHVVNVAASGLTLAADLDVRARDVRELPARVRERRADTRRPASPDDVEVPEAWCCGAYHEGWKVCDTRIVGAIAREVEALLIARKAVDDERRRVVLAFRAVLYARKTLQQVADVWPLAMDLAERFNAIQAISGDAIGIVRGASFTCPGPADPV